MPHPLPRIKSEHGWDWPRITSRYVKKFADIVRPLTSFVNSRKQFKRLTTEMSKAIEDIKAILTTEPVLSHPNFDLPFSVHCDASPQAISAVLTQVVNV